MGELSELPDEIIEFILTYLPPYKDLENCRLVNKRWHEIVQNLIRRSKLNLHKGVLDFKLQWQQFQPTEKDNSISGTNTMVPIIAGRFSHSAVRRDNYMYIFGGGSSSDTTFNDLWRFDLSQMRWERPSICRSSSYPSPKGSATMVYWKDHLVLFGGWRYPSLYPPYQPWCLFDELHYFDLLNQRWMVHEVLMPCPPPIAGHSATVHGDRMIVFGGYQIADGVNSLNNETWCLNLKEPRWWQPRIAGNLKPPPRYGQFQVELSETHLLILGGCGGPNSVFSDAWLLDMSQDDLWAWRSVPIRNKNFGASNMWCNPACKVNNQLVVLGPTPNMPQDFLMMKQTRVPVGGINAAQRLGAGQQQNNAMANYQPGHAIQNNRQNNLQNGAAMANGGGGIGDGVNGGGAGAGGQYAVNRRAILNQHMQNALNLLNNNLNNSGNNLQPRTGRLSELHGVHQNSSNNEERNHNRPSSSSTPISQSPSQSSSSVNTSSSNNRVQNESPSPSIKTSNNSNDIEAANRLQRNLALRCRENEPLLPKRFDEFYEDRFRMAAFDVTNRPRNISKDHNERIRRMEEKMNALRNSRRNAAVILSESKLVKEPSPKRVKRNVLSLFVCDLSEALSTDPHLRWLEYKNNGVMPGAPERLILSTMIAGHGELILFGGVHKETLGEITHQVSNSIHFLSAPKDIV